jgi:hypothetical protein
MRLPPAFCFVLLVARLAAAGQPATTVWHLDQIEGMGGHAVTVLGAPQVAKEAGAAAVHFNGASDGLFVPVNPLQGAETFTIEVLFNPAADGPVEQRFLHLQDTPTSRALLEIRLAGGTWALDAFLFSPVTKGRLVLLDATKRHPADRWTWVAMVYDGKRLTSYVDGVKELEGEVSFPLMSSGRVSLGVRQNKVSWFKGGLREVRWHTRAVSAEDLQRP